MERARRAETAATAAGRHLSLRGQPPPPRQLLDGYSEVTESCAPSRVNDRRSSTGRIAPRRYVLCVQARVQLSSAKAAEAVLLEQRRATRKETLAAIAAAKGWIQTVEAPATANEASATADEAPTTADEVPATADEAPATADDEAPATADEAPTTADEVSATADEEPATADDEALATADEAPVDEVPATADEALIRDYASLIASGGGSFFLNKNNLKKE